MPISSNQYRKQFLATETAVEIRKLLEQMEESPLYFTKATYQAGNPEDISFSDKHLAYISTHPAVQPDQYMSNLRLMTKIRR